jgi:hypothetical protein
MPAPDELRADRAVGVVRRAHQLDVVGPAGEPVGVARPAEVARELEVRLRRVRLACMHGMNSPTLE